MGLGVTSDKGGRVDPQGTPSSTWDLRFSTRIDTPVDPVPFSLPDLVPTPSPRHTSLKEVKGICPSVHSKCPLATPGEPKIIPYTSLHPHLETHRVWSYV